MVTEQPILDTEEATGSVPAGLRQFVVFDLVATVLSTIVILGTFAFITRSGWLLVLAVLVGASGALMAMGLRSLRRGDPTGTVRWMASANWSVALAASAIATFVWPNMMVAALLPAVLAAQYMPIPRLRWYLMASMVVAMGVAAFGLLQDFSGFEDQLPSWLPPTIVIIFAPFLVWMVVQVALQHSTRLQAALGQTLSANEQLRRSERVLAEQAEAIRASRARLVAATDRERRRVERDLHDGAQQRLVALGLRLRMAQDLCRTDPARAGDALDELRSEVHAAQRELRDLAHGVYPPVLTQHGLAAALSAAADRCPIPVDLDADGLDRVAADVETAVYFCCAEALQNAAKHAGDGARVTVTIAQDGTHLRFEVADDGVGFDTGAHGDGTGFENLRDRLGAAGGTLEVTSTPGRGTSIVGCVPATPVRAN